VDKSDEGPRMFLIKKALYILSVWVGFGWWEFKDI
jgi:hypothetical protein